ncbi:MAG: metallophosphoesterase, partial [Lachnospiraceae bacterium]|nr:metallophosphoesterase [Lachnospiraceae bacterium]
LLLVAGDMFHKQPLLKELKMVSRELSAIPSTRVVIIAGNHDYISGNSFYRRFEWPENVHFIDTKEISRLYFEDIDTEVYGCSYLERDFFEPVYDGIKPEFPDRINILLGHGGDERNIPTDFKQLSRAGFDYVAMGHIHKPQDIADNIRYSGSPEPLDKNENGKHGFIEGEILCPSKNTGKVDPADLSADNAENPEFGFSGESGNPEFFPGQELINDIRKCVSLTGKTVCSRRVLSAKRQYIKTELTVTPDDTELTLRQRITRLISETGDMNIYVITLTGERSPDAVIETESFDDLGNILEVVDGTLPKLDFDRLALENADNVIGCFINEMRSGQYAKPDGDPLREKALYLGVMALTGRSV